MIISIVGAAGRVGSNAAFALQCLGLGTELRLIDVNEKGVSGEALDLMHGSAFTSPQRILYGGSELLDGSDIVIVTAGLRRKPDESRLQLINRNTELFLNIMNDVRKAALDSEALLLVVTNPVDILTRVAIDRSGLSPEKVIGLGTLLDTLRFRSLLAEHFQVDATQITATLLGEHGDSMVPMWSSAAIQGVPLTSHPRYDQATIFGIFERAMKSGAEVISKKGGAGYAVGVAIARFVQAVIEDAPSILPVSTLINGPYGINDVCLSVPTVLGRKGVLDQLEVELWPKELSGLRLSAEALTKTLSQVEY